MAANSKIEWTHHTFNPWIGCSKVSPGCAYCYAETLMDTRWGKVKWGPNGNRVRTADAYWRQPMKWNRLAEQAGERHRVFCASLADVFEDRPELVPWRRDLFHLITCTPHLDWLVLTKRPENALRMMVEAGLYTVENPNLPCPQPNLWVGTSVEDKARRTRIDHLRKVQAVVRFLSMEPLLEDLGCVNLDGIHWGIVGGESGHGARPVHPEWVRSLRDQFGVAGLAFFFKQRGEWSWCEDEHGLEIPPDWATKPQTYRFMQTDGTLGTGYDGGRGQFIVRVGKKAAGRMLDGREWSEFPASAVPACQVLQDPAEFPTGPSSRHLPEHHRQRGDVRSDVTLPASPQPIPKGRRSTGEHGPNDHDHRDDVTPRRRRIERRGEHGKETGRA